jgi:uroporphyrinogen-III decarboxylase
MTAKRRFLAGLLGGRVDRPPVGSPTSVATVECMERSGAFHFDSKVAARTATGIVRGRISLVGNVNNPEVLLRGTPADAYRMA